jgi:hypothetical protein
MLDVLSLSPKTSTPNKMVVGGWLHNKLKRIAIVESQVFGRGTFAVDSILKGISRWFASTCYSRERTQSFA